MGRGASVREGESRRHAVPRGPMRLESANGEGEEKKRAWGARREREPGRVPPPFVRSHSLFYLAEGSLTHQLDDVVVVHEWKSAR